MRLASRTNMPSEASGPLALRRELETQMKAQISVETLLVFVLFLVLLGIAYTASTRLGAASQQSINAALSRESFNELSGKIEEACLLGGGNLRVVLIKGPAATLSSSGQELSFNTPSLKQPLKKKSNCGLNIEKTGASAEFSISNENGEVFIR